MTLETNQEELKRLKNIILATIDYSLQKSADIIKIDGRVPGESYYQELKQSTKYHFKQKNFAKLQQILSKVLETPVARGDGSFDNYIKEKTGYEISIFKNIEENTDKIIKQNKIENEEEFYDAARMIHKLKQEYADEDKINVLDNLCRDFAKLRNKTKILDDKYIPKELSHIQSPNKKYRLIVSESEQNGEYGVTSVCVTSKNGGASIYDVERINLDIKAYWEGDNTIIIESKKEYKALSRRNQIQFGNDVIDVNLIED